MNRRIVKQLGLAVVAVTAALAFNNCSGFSSLIGSISASGTRASFATASNGHCFVTGGGAPITVCHNVGDEGVFYATPTNRVAYNAQVVKLSDTEYRTVYHSEARDSAERNTPRMGDSVRVGAHSGPYNYQIPGGDNPYALWGSTTDTQSFMYYGVGTPNQWARGTSGAGNPMMVAGRTWAGDSYHYMFFLTVSDLFAYQQADWKHYLHIARTTDYRNWDILTTDSAGQKQYQPFNDRSAEWQRRPIPLMDKSGQAVMSTIAGDIDNTQGLIGSVLMVNQHYYFFYTDRDPADASKMVLYVRESADISQGDWSTPTLVTQERFGVGVIVRVAKAKGMDRWSVIYSCVSPETDLSDLCVQYTENLNISGPGGLGSLKFFSDGSGRSPYYLGLQISACENSALRAQHYPMTDIFGNLASPNGEDSIERGGMVSWLDLCSNAPYGAPMFRAGWDVKGADGVSAPGTGGTATPGGTSTGSPASGAPAPAATPAPAAQPTPGPPASTEGLNPVAMLRFFNASTNKHFYSASEAEGRAGGSNLEGTIFTFVGGTGTAGTFPIYRCFGQSLFISTAVNCEGTTRVDAQAYGSLFITQGGAGRTPVFRLYNPVSGDRILTTNSNEGTSAGYTLEGIIGFAL